MGRIISFTISASHELVNCRDRKYLDSLYLKEREILRTETFLIKINNIILRPISLAVK